MSVRFQHVADDPGNRSGNCYRMCHSTRPLHYANSGIMELVPEKPDRLRKLVWLVDSLDRLTGFPPAVRHKFGFALYQAQIG